MSMDLFQRLQIETQAEQEWLASLPIIQAALSGNISQAVYVEYLAQAYHHVKHTVPLMMSCGANLIAKARWVQVFMAEYIEEELGHEQWILNDIAAAGGDMQAVKSSYPAPACEQLVAYAYDMINRVNPYGFFGMIFVLEGTSVKLASQVAGAVQASLGLPDKAFTYLTSHGEVDQEHIEFLRRLVNKVESKEDQDLIVRAAKQFFRLYGGIFEELAAAE